MVAPFAPHIAEELWRGWATRRSLAYEPFPVADPALLVAETVTYAVQVKGKVRGRLEVAAVVGEDDAARAGAGRPRPCSGRWTGADVRTVIVRAPKLVNVVPA